MKKQLVLVAFSFSRGMVRVFIYKFKRTAMIKNIFVAGFAIVFSFVNPAVILAEELLPTVEESTEEERGGQGGGNEDNITICHANNGENGYSVISVDPSAVDGEGNNDHTSHEGDIIPITDLNDDGDITVEDCLIAAGDNDDDEGDEEEDDQDEEEEEDEDEEEPNTSITIIADMIICDSETLLPNWGNGGSNITSTTASSFVSENEDCFLASDRLFQWGDDSMTFGGDETLGEVAGYTTAPATDGNGRTSFTVDLSELSAPNRIEMRMVLEEGDIPFTFTAQGNANTNDVSAEFYCHTDVLNYDNWDWINNPVAGETYYCVGFNVEVEEEPLVCIPGNLIVNGSFEEPALGGDWDVYSEDETLWNISWVNPYDGQPEDALLEFQNHLVTAQDGEQYAELDSDWGFASGEPAGVTISQTLATVPGIDYEVSFYTHARPGTVDADNTLDLVISLGDSEETMSVQAVSEWTRHSYVFTAVSTETEVAFSYTGTENSLGMFLDNVSVDCAFEPNDDGDDEEENGDDEGDDEDPTDDEENDDTPTDDEDPNDDGDDQEENPTDDEDDQTPTDEDDTNEESTSTGSSSSSGSRRSSGNSQGEVLGATTSAVCPQFTLHHRRGDVGGEVSLIQDFLNQHMSAGLVVDGVFGPATEKAVHAFQQKYWEQIIKPWTPELSSKTTGRWYKTTRAWANELMNCRELPQVLEDTGRWYSTADFTKTEETVENTDSAN